jgi:hypothetical protein
VGGGGLGAVEGAVEVDVDDAGVVGERAVHHRALGPGDAGVGDEDVQSAVEVLDRLVDGLLDGFGAGDIDLVCLGCGGGVSG